MKLTDFDKIHCLCVDHRRNDWARIDKQFGERGAKVEKFIVGKGKILPKEMYSQIDPEDVPAGLNWFGFTTNAYCCYLSHRKMIEQAQKEGVKTLLLLEDDCELLPEFDRTLEKAGEQIKALNLKWDMLWLASNHTWGHTEEVSPNILKLLGGSYCWHAVAINQEHNNMFQHLLDLPARGAFDWLTSVYTQPNYNCYAVFPNFAIQRPGISYVLGSYQNYLDWMLNRGSVK